MKVIASRQIPIVNTHQVVWQPVTENGDRSMRLAPIDWQPSGAHACIQMLADDLRNAEAKLTKAVEERDELGRRLNTALYGQPHFAWSIHEEEMADLRAKLTKAVETLREIADGSSDNSEAKAKRTLDELEGK